VRSDRARRADDPILASSGSPSREPFAEAFRVRRSSSTTLANAGNCRSSSAKHRGIATPRCRTHARRAPHAAAHGARVRFRPRPRRHRGRRAVQAPARGRPDAVSATQTARHRRAIRCCSRRGARQSSARRRADRARSRVRASGSSARRQSFSTPELIAEICHGVLVAVRSTARGARDGRSVLHELRAMRLPGTRSTAPPHGVLGAQPARSDVPALRRGRVAARIARL
jgi:hypothetical protein